MPSSITFLRDISCTERLSAASVSPRPVASSKDSLSRCITSKMWLFSSWDMDSSRCIISTILFATFGFVTDSLYALYGISRIDLASIAMLAAEEKPPIAPPAIPPTIYDIFTSSHTVFGLTSNLSLPVASLLMYSTPLMVMD